MKYSKIDSSVSITQRYAVAMTLWKKEGGESSSILILTMTVAKNRHDALINIANEVSIDYPGFKITKKLALEVNKDLSGPVD